MKNNDTYITLGETARRSGYSRRHLVRMVESGALPALVFKHPTAPNRNRILVAVSELDRLTALKLANRGGPKKKQEATA